MTAPGASSSRWRVAAVAVALAALGCEQASSGSTPDVPNGGVSFATDTSPASKDTAVIIGDDDVGPAPQDVATEPEDTTTPPADVPALPCAVDGTACNDGDACTADDRCAGGTCAGVPLACDDKLLCTVDLCTNGQCGSELITGYCLIAGNCYPSGTANPLNPCQRCDPAVSSAAWSSATGPCVAPGACGNAVGTCEQGQCVVPGGAVCPEDGNPCTTASCVGGTCSQVPTPGLCDDGNPCTTGDTCTSGVCVGTPTVTCPDDGNPCTDAVCTGGGCTTVPKVGPCDDGNPCTTGDACSGVGTCTPGVGKKDADSDGDADVACGGTDCNDAVKAIGATQAETCANGVDDDCDGATDAADDACGSKLGKACSYHADCHPEGVCATRAGTGATVCSARCGKQADCAAGEMCTRLPGGAHVGFCEPSPLAGKAAGAACAVGADCAGGLCFEGQCRTTCFDEAGCSTSEDCAWFYTAQGTFVTFCLNPATYGLKAVGQACTTDNINYGGDACASGLCDLTGATASTWKCTSVCGSEKDCSASQECHLMAYAPETATDATPYHPQFTEVVHDGVAGCYTSQSTGILGDGLPCNADQYWQCKSNKCMAIDPDQPSQSFCTTFCNTDADCVAGMKCKIVPLTLVSEYLLSDTGAQDPALAAYSYFQLCTYP